MRKNLWMFEAVVDKVPVRFENRYPTKPNKEKVSLAEAQKPQRVFELEPHSPRTLRLCEECLFLIGILKF